MLFLQIFLYHAVVLPRRYRYPHAIRGFRPPFDWTVTFFSYPIYPEFEVEGRGQRPLPRPQMMYKNRRPSSRNRGLQLGHSTVAGREVYKPKKFGGPSSINGGDMVPFIFHRNP